MWGKLGSAEGQTLQASDTCLAFSHYRTARANNPGIVLTFVLPTEQSSLGKIEELLSGGKSPCPMTRSLAARLLPAHLSWQNPGVRQDD